METISEETVKYEPDEIESIEARITELSEYTSIKVIDKNKK